MIRGPGSIRYYKCCSFRPSVRSTLMDGASEAIAMNQPQSLGILGPDEFRKIREVFESAIELAPAERARFIDQSCDGDPRLIAEVQRMLSGDAEGNALLDGRAAGHFNEVAMFAGHLRLGALLARGGMGEVHRAHDIHLRRDVALKVLPSTFALDPGRVARFKREAEVLASLNHPNIAGIYGLEESGGMYALGSSWWKVLPCRSPRA